MERRNQLYLEVSHIVDEVENPAANEGRARQFGDTGRVFEQKEDQTTDEGTTVVIGGITR